jgi:hypothetical protein
MHEPMPPPPVFSGHDAYLTTGTTLFLPLINTISHMLAVDKLFPVILGGGLETAL